MEETIKEYLSYAEIAFSNKEYETALTWYNKVLELVPNHAYTLARAGSACIPMSRFDEAKTFFERAVKVEPDNGDYYFHLANAYFFHNEFPQALELYATAEMKGCTEAVKPRLYYQMALLCSFKGDAASAIANYEKYEQYDNYGDIVGNHKIVLEKMRLYLQLGNIEKAENCASQLMLVAPKELSSYLVYAQMLMVHQKYQQADAVLTEAEKNVQLTDAGKIDLELQRLTLHIAKAEELRGAGDPQTKAYYEQVIQALHYYWQNSMAYTKKQYQQIVLTLAEVYLKLERFDECLMVVSSVLQPSSMIADPPPVPELTPEMVTSITAGAVQDIRNRMASGEISDAEVSYQADGSEAPIYPEAVLKADAAGTPDYIAQTMQKVKELNAQETAEEQEYVQKLKFIRLSCYIGKEDYKSVVQCAVPMKGSKNVYYAYFSVYMEAYAIRKLSNAADGYSENDAEAKYKEAIAFFKSKMMQKENVIYATIFRIRLYAESGKFALAEELLGLLTTEQRSPMQAYIEECRKQTSAS